MSRTKFDSLVIEKSLSIVNDSGNESAIEYAHNNGLGDDFTKNLCVRITHELSDRIENVVKILGVPKRKFLETLIITGCDRSEELMREEGVFNHFAEMNDLLNAEGRFTEADKAVAEGRES